MDQLEDKQVGLQRRRRGTGEGVSFLYGLRTVIVRRHQGSCLQLLQGSGTTRDVEYRGACSTYARPVSGAVSVTR